jgi:[ribosomal protein S5]-alanine N-acetyltransferase
VVEAFDRFRLEVLRCGPVTMIPERTRVAFHTRMSFAVLMPRTTHLRGHLVLPGTVRSKRFDKIERVGRRTVVHSFRFAGPEEIDDRVSSWIARSYLVGLQRHLPYQNPQPIRSRRLDLVSMTPEAMVALLRGDRPGAERALGAGIPDERSPGDWSWFRFRLAEYAADPEALPWMARAMVLRGRWPRVVGNAGFHGRPGADGVPEIGYEVASTERRRGFATEAASALIEWAAAEHGVERFRAVVGPWNTISLRIVRGLGFRQVGVQTDEVDGEELVFVLERPSAFRPSR